MRSAVTLASRRFLAGTSLGQAAKLQSEPWWDASLLMPLGEEMASILSGYLETGRQVVEDSLPDS